MERKIGEIFTYEGKTYQVVKANTCKNCAFFNKICGPFQSLAAGSCTPGGRIDKINVAFKEINNMENNQLTIEIPEGMEIDVKNSDLVNGVVKFKTKDTTYKDIEDTLNIERNRTGVAADTRNSIKLCALDKLMNIARYYNKEWEPNWSNPKENKYCIKFDYHKDRFYVDYNNSIGAGDVFFKNSEDARAVINNPNFKSILNTIYKN